MKKKQNGMLVHLLIWNWDMILPSTVPDTKGRAYEPEFRKKKTRVTGVKPRQIWTRHGDAR
jgi:hypothetical protein